MYILNGCQGLELKAGILFIVRGDFPLGCGYKNRVDQRIVCHSLLGILVLRDR